MVQATDRAVGLMILLETARWLNLTKLANREKEDLLDMPVVLQGLFGSAVASMQKRCEDKKKEDEALKLCLPRKIQPSTTGLPRQTFAQAVAHPHGRIQDP